MVIHIWSDIACPFCYIGKRHLEAALKEASLQEEVQLVWHSYQLDPDATPVPGVSYIESLASRKGWSREQTLGIFDHVTSMAATAGLDYHFENIVEANTLNAHQLLHLAAEFNVQDVAKERLFRSHFCDGLDIGDMQVLGNIGDAIGVPKDQVLARIKSGEFLEAVRNDIEQANRMGIRGVPFFLINNTITVSGAQPVDVFVSALRQASEN